MNSIRIIIALVLSALVLLPSTASLQSQTDKPEGLSPQAGGGLAAERMAVIDSGLQRYVDDNRVAGIVALVLQDGKPVYEKAFGWADKEAGRRMTTDTIFRIASQTKALTSVAIMQLIEEGRLTPGRRAGDFIPTFARTTVATGKTGETLVTEPAHRPITIRDLLTHTAGISYGTDPLVADLYQAKGLGPAAGFGWYTADKDEPVCATMERLGTLPFVAQPGERWVYGYNTDILGCIVEKVSGMPLDEYLRTRIITPLGMKDTAFFVPAADRSRLAAVYASRDGGVVRAPDGARGQGHYADGPRKNFAGGAGLVSTARDYARFLEAIRLGGTVDGVRVLSPRSVRLMATNQVGTLHSASGLGFGLGFGTTDRFGASGMQSEGSFGWGGAYGSVYRIDPEEKLVMVLMLQLIPNSSDIREAFPNLVYQAVP
ncbi:MAG: serine hydrolase domain-containing protein [Acidobacteriota bacterium]|nr:serine hydrolase domain-containing protein [Acidobacteriota bacterium]